MHQTDDDVPSKIDRLLSKGRIAILHTLFERKQEGEEVEDLAGFVWDLNSAVLPEAVRERYEPETLQSAREQGELFAEGGTMYRSVLAAMLREQAPDIAKALRVPSQEERFPCVVIAYGKIVLRWMQTDFGRWTLGGSA